MMKELQLIYGFHSVEAALNNNSSGISRILFDSQRHDKRCTSLLRLAQNSQVKIEHVNCQVLDQLSHNANHQGVVAELNQSQTNKTTLTFKELLLAIKDKNNAIVLVLDGITDPHNLGAIIRSAECFGVDAVIIPKDNSANANNPTVVKVSSAATNYIPVITVNNLVTAINELQEHEFWVAGTSLGDKSVSLFEFKPPGRIAWVMGSEGDGIRRLVADNCDYLVSIPLYGNTESLNVSVATGVVLAYTKLCHTKK